MEHALQFSEFDQISRKQWLEKIRADLDGQSPEDVAWQYDADLAIDPFVHADDAEVITSYVPRTSQWLCGDCFAVYGNEQKVNGEILESLAGGVEALHIEVHSAPDWAQLLQDVHLNLVHMTLDFRYPESSPDPFFTWLQEQGVQRSDCSLTIRGTGPDKADGTRTIPIDGSMPIIDGIVHGLDQCMDIGVPVEFTFEIGTAYFVEIARLRALKILWYNLQLVKNANARATIEVHLSNDALSDDVDQNIIRAGSMTLSAILGGADRIYTRVVPSEEEPSGFHRRMARNMHHLLRHESRIDQWNDPVSGAYYIEKLTQKIVREVWERLQM